MGLIGTFAGGMAPGLERMGNTLLEGQQREKLSAQEAGSREDLMQKELAAREAMQIQLEKRINAQKQSEGQAIESGAQGLINARTEQMARSAESSPNAEAGVGAFIRSERGVDPLEQARARSQAAGSLGNTTAQKEYNDQAKDIQSADYQKERNKITDEYNKDRAIREDNFRELQVRHMNVMEGKATASEDKRDKQAFRSGIQTLMSETRKSVEDLQKQKADASPGLAKVLDAQITDHQKEIARYSSALSDELGVKPADAPKVAPPSEADITGLKERANNPVAIAAFNSRFGAGAADKYLPPKNPDPLKTKNPERTETRTLDVIAYDNKIANLKNKVDIAMSALNKTPPIYPSSGYADIRRRKTAEKELADAKSELSATMKRAGDTRNE